MNEKTRRRRTGETGVVRSIDAEPLAGKEPPMPPDLPEVPESGSITGFTPIQSEGRDRAKEDDDTGKQTAAN
jgi:hypothetical protein